MKSTRFMYTKMVGRRTAEAMGVHSKRSDALAFASLFAPLGIGFGALSLLKKVPGGRARIDQRATEEILRQLANEGTAEYRTNESDYKFESV